MIHSRDVDDLHPKVRVLALRLQWECRRVGIDLVFTSTYRDNEAQDELYTFGRTVIGTDKTQRRPMGRILTNRKAGQSYHNYRVAFDAVIIKHGKIIHDSKALWKQVGAIAQKLGLDWAGSWINLREVSHFQYTEGLKWQDFQAGKNLSE